MKASIILFVIVLLAGCAGTTQNGKYMQMTHPVNNTIVMQVDSANYSNCRVNRESFVAGIKGAKEIGKFVSCSNMSASSILPYQLTVNDKALNILSVIEMATQEMCDVLAEGLLNDPKVTVITPCHKK